MHHRFELQTRGQGLTEFTSQVAGWLKECGAHDGLLTLFVRHTSFGSNLPEVFVIKTGWETHISGLEGIFLFAVPI